MLFNDKYLSYLLNLVIPGEFESLDDHHMDNPALSELNLNYLKTNQDEGHIELKLFTSLKLFFKERQLDLAEVLKQIRIKK
jgi:hypothetical protein